MNAEIITVGTELLLGDILNSNSQFLSQELAALGIAVFHQSTVGDNVDRLKAELTEALSRSDLVIVTGGLGPTQDDLTRETVCEVLGIQAALHEESWAAITAYFERTGREMAAANQKQAMLPVGCTVFANDHGTAPGCAVEQDGRIVVMLPGPPRELIPMFKNKVAPYLAPFGGGVIASYTVHVFGIPEGTVAERTADLMEGENPTVAPYAKEGEVTLRVTARADTAEAADALCQPIIADIKERLGQAVYLVGDGGLQDVVVSLLRENGKKLATAESCTAGMLSGRLTQVPGASDVFDCGIASYSNDIKHQVLGVPTEMLETYGAVSAETVCAMAIGARRVGNADIGVGISGVAGPSESEGKPVGTVFIALADDKRVWVKKVVVGRTNDREQIRFIATSHTLDLIRKYLLALPTVMTGGITIPTESDPATAAAVIPSAPVDPDAPAPKKGRWAKWLFIILMLIGIGIALMFTDWLLPYWKDTPLYDALFGVVEDHTDAGALPDDLPSGGGSDTPSSAPAGTMLQFETLFAQNDEVRGWLTVPAAGVDTPVMQSVDADYYVDHSFEKTEDAVGTPYFSQSASFHSPYADNRVLRISGQNAAGKSGFGGLVHYTKAATLKAHPSFRLDTLFEEAQWEIFSVAIIHPDDFNFAGTPRFDDEAFAAYIDELEQRSLFKTSVIPDISDQLLILDTDVSAESGIDGAKLVIAARKMWDGADEVAYKVTTNKAAVTPAGFKGLTTTAGATSTTVSSTATSQDETTTTVKKTTTTKKTTTKKTTTTTKKKTTTKKTTTTKKKTTTTKKPTTTEKVTTTKKTTNTTSLSASTTNQTTTGTTATPLPSVAPLVASKVIETEHFKNFQVKASGTVSGILPHATKEEVQLAVAMLVNHELGYSKADDEALKAQAVVAYTYTLYYVQTYGKPYAVKFDKTFDPNGSSFEKRLYKAVGEVVGVKLQDTKTGDFPYTPYFAASAGITAANHEVYNSKLAHLMPVDSSVETVEMSKKYINGKTYPVISVTTWTKDELIKELTDWAGATVKFSNSTFKVTGYGTAVNGVKKYVTKTSAYYTDDDGDKVYLTGRNVRSALGLRSHAFDVAYDGDTITITNYGWGHGVGMSQLGAMVYAGEHGWTYDQILSHYYSITTSSKVRIIKPKWED